MFVRFRQSADSSPSFTLTARSWRLSSSNTNILYCRKIFTSAVHSPTVHFQRVNLTSCIDIAVGTPLPSFSVLRFDSPITHFTLTLSNDHIPCLMNHPPKRASYAQRILLLEFHHSLHVTVYPNVGILKRGLACYHLRVWTVSFLPIVFLYSGAIHKKGRWHNRKHSVRYAVDSPIISGGFGAGIENCP